MCVPVTIYTPGYNTIRYMLTITKYCCYYINAAKTTDYPLKIDAEMSGLRLSNTKALAAL